MTGADTGAGPRWRIGSLCAGYGGLDLGLLAALHGQGQITWCADSDRHVRTVLTARMPDAPNLGDITVVDWSTVPPVDVITAGFPCQDISGAGKRAGIRAGGHSGVWANVMDAIRLLRPARVLLENVAALRWRGGGLDAVLGDLAQAGYDAIWRCVRASEIGAPHQRERIFVLGHRTGGVRGRRPLGNGTRGWTPSPDSDREQPERRREDRKMAGPASAAPGHADQRERDRGSAGDRRPAPARLGRWGSYAPAIHRWELITGRPAPAPLEPGQRGQRLAPTFVEWLIVPAGWVTDLPIPPSRQVQILGNGVLPAQAEQAARLLLGDLRSVTREHSDPRCSGGAGACAGGGRR